MNIKASFNYFNGIYLIYSYRNMILFPCFLVWKKLFYKSWKRQCIEKVKEKCESLCLWRRFFESFTSLCVLHFLKSWHKIEQKYKGNKRNLPVIFQIRLLREFIMIKISSLFLCICPNIAFFPTNVLYIFLHYCK